jgi:hypothetical protein
MTMAKRIASSLSGVSVADLQAELRRRSRRVGTLQRRRDRVARKLAALDAELAALGATMVGAGGGALLGRKRPKNDMNLVEALAKVLKGKTMSVTDVSEAVQKSGYKTSAANFRTIVNQTLIKNRSVFKKISRGQYTAA